MARMMKWLLLVAGCVAVIGIAYWQSSLDATIPVPPAALQLKPVVAPTTSNDTAAATASNDQAAAVPAKAASSAVTRQAPPRVQQRDQTAAVTVERRDTALRPSAPDANPSPARAMSYERRVADATAAGAEDSDRALRELQRLAADQPDRPEAYEAMAGLSLRKKDYGRARELIDSALAHGGRATFTLIHDHNRGNFDAADPKATCVGELTILAGEVRFEPPGVGDRFSASWADVRETGSNKFFGSGIGAFHVTTAAGGKYQNFNLAPESKDKAEGKLVLDLLTAYTRKTDRTR